MEHTDKLPPMRNKSNNEQSDFVGTSNVEHRTSNIERRTSNVEHRTSNKQEKYKFLLTQAIKNGHKNDKFIILRYCT